MVEGQSNYEEGAFQAWALGYNRDKYPTEDEAREAGREEYAILSEERRQQIIYRIADHLTVAINEKNINKSKSDSIFWVRYKELRALTWALHVTADDFAHRQVNVGWIDHIPGRWSGSSDVDRMEREENWVRARAAVEACKEIFLMYAYPGASYEDRFEVISNLIPVKHFKYKYDNEPME